MEKKREEGLLLNIKICFNKDNVGASEPTQLSQCIVIDFFLLFFNDLMNFLISIFKKTKTVQVNAFESAQEVVSRCLSLFNLNVRNGDDQIDLENVNYQLGLKITPNGHLIPLVGHELPFEIKMNYLRESGKSVRDDDNSYKFILINKSAQANKSAISSANGREHCLEVFLLTFVILNIFFSKQISHRQSRA